MSTEDAIRALEEAIREAPSERLLRLLGELGRLKTIAEAMFSRPEPADSLLTADEAANVLHLSPKTLYRNADKYPFARREGRLVRFSARGVQEHLRRAR